MAEQELFRLRRVSFAYDRQPVIAGVDLALTPGRFYGIVGPNGSGKTTLLDLLIGDKEPGSGSIAYKGREVRQYGRRRLSRQIALVPQDFQINFAFTVMEAVMMGRHPYLPRFGNPLAADFAVARQAMREIGIESFGGRLVTDLSGGEKQRVVAARALTQQTPVLILDEATSNLDIRFSLQILNVARKKVDEGGTVIAVLHNLNLAAAFCDHITFLKNGEVCRSGETAEVLTARTIREVFGVESRVGVNSYSGKPQIEYRCAAEGQA